MRQSLLLASLVAAALLGLGGVAAWLDHAGYSRAKAECALAAARQTAEIATLRRKIEESWRTAGDRINTKRKELDDAVAAVEASSGGGAVCLPADSVRALDAIR